MNQVPIPRRSNPLTDAMDNITSVNVNSGSPVGVRVRDVPTIPGTSQGGGAVLAAPPLSPQEARDREIAYYRETGIKVGSLVDDPYFEGDDVSNNADGKGVPALQAQPSTAPPKWTPPSQRTTAIGPIDFADIQQINFKDRTIVVGGASIPLSDKCYRSLAGLAATALLESIQDLATIALKRLVPEVPSGEKMPEVPPVETTGGIQ